SVAIEIDGPEAGGRQLTDATARLRTTETWRALLWAAAHEANLHLAEGRAAAVLESFRPIFEPRPPSLYDVEDFALASRVVLPAALLAGDRRVLNRWIDDPTVAAGRAIHQAAADHGPGLVARRHGNRTA